MKARAMRYTILAALLIGGVALADPPAAPTTTVLLVRHAEKATTPADDPPLSALGRQRVEALGLLLAESGVTRIFASDKRRTQDTVAPLAARLGLTVEIVPAKEIAVLVAAIRAQPGGVVLVAAHSNTLGEIAQALGAPAPPPIADDDYDNLYVVTLPAGGGATLLCLRWAP